MTRLLYSFPHPLGAPGIGHIAWQQAKGAIELGLDVTVVCTSLASPVPGARKVVETLTLRGRRVPHRVLGVDRAYAYHDRRAARILAQMEGDVDVVHTWPLGALHTLRAARDLGVVGVREMPNTHTADAYRLAGAATESVGVTMPRRYSHRPSARRLALEEQEYEAAMALLAPSPFVARSLEQRLPSARVVRHQYGFDPERFPAPGPELPDRPFGLAFVGSGEPRKGLHVALEAWRASGLGGRGGRFVVCGRLVPAYAERLAPLLDQPGVHVRPFTSDVGAVLRASDALVLASFEEGSALVTYEAQASGCALLVSDASGALCDDGVHGFIHAAGDVDALTGHLVELGRRSDALAGMRAACIAHRDELSWSTAARRLVAAYHEAGGPGAA